MLYSNCNIKTLNDNYIVLGALQWSNDTPGCRYSWNRLVKVLIATIVYLLCTLSLALSLSRDTSSIKNHVRMGTVPVGKETAKHNASLNIYYKAFMYRWTHGGATIPTSQSERDRPLQEERASQSLQYSPCHCSQTVAASFTMYILLCSYENVRQKAANTCEFPANSAQWEMTDGGGVYKLHD